MLKTSSPLEGTCFLRRPFPTRLLRTFEFPPLKFPKVAPIVDPVL